MPRAPPNWLSWRRGSSTSPWSVRAPPIPGLTRCLPSRKRWALSSPPPRPTSSLTLPGHVLAGGKVNVAGHGLLDRLTCADLDASPPQDAPGGFGQVLVEFGQQARGGVEQQPADRLARQARHLAGQAGGLQLALGGHFGSGVAGADDDEGAAGLALGGIGGRGGQLKLADDVIAEVDGLGDAAEPVRVCPAAGVG